MPEGVFHLLELKGIGKTFGGVEALGAPLRAGMAERALRHDHLALAVDRIDEGLGDGSTHELVVGREEGVDVNLIERSNKGVHVDDGRTGVDHLLHGLGQCADTKRLDRHEIPLLRRHVVDGGAIIAGVAAVGGGEKSGQGIPKSVVTDGPVVTKANAAGMQWMEDHFLI